MTMEGKRDEDHNPQSEEGVTCEDEAVTNKSDPMELDSEEKNEAMETQEQDCNPPSQDKPDDTETQKEDESSPTGLEQGVKAIVVDEAPKATNGSTNGTEEKSPAKRPSKEEEIVVTPDCGFFGLNQPGCSKDCPQNDDDEKNWEDIDSDEDDFPCFDNSAEIPETVAALKSALTATESLSICEGVTEQAKKKASDAIKDAIEKMNEFQLSGRTLEKSLREIIIDLLQATFDPNKSADAEAEKLEERLKEEMKIRNGILNSIQNQYSECHAVLKVLFAERQRQKEKGNKISAVPRRILRNVGLQVSKIPLTDEERGIAPKRPAPKVIGKRIITTKTNTTPLMTQQIRRSIPITGIRMRAPTPRLQPTRMSMLNSRMGPPSVTVRGQPINRMGVSMGQNTHGRFSAPPPPLLLRSPNGPVIYRNRPDPALVRGKIPLSPQINSDEEFKRATAKKSTAPRRNPPPPPPPLPHVVFKKPQDVIVIDDD